MLDPNLRLADAFPVLQRQVHGRRLAYLDSAATTQKPQCVIDAIGRYYQRHNANVHRGMHCLSAEATEAYEAARVALGQWVGAADPSKEIIFTKGATEALNLIAHGMTSWLSEGDEILLSTLEHHANIVPWQQLAKRTGAVIRVIPMVSSGALDLDAYQKCLTSRTKVVAVNGISNALGTINPIAKMAEMAHQVDAMFVCDATQMGAHRPIDVQQMQCDFLVLSGHKMYGPTGIGLCYGREALLAKLDPYQTGGEMIDVVTFTAATFKAPPYGFEAGTPNMAGAVGWHRAIDFVGKIGWSEIMAHEQSLLAMLDAGLDAIPEVRRYSCAPNKTAVASFAVHGCHPQDIATLLDTFGVAVRSGHHCTMPLMTVLGVPGLVRASLGVYTQPEDITQLLEALPKVIGMLV